MIRALLALFLAMPALAQMSALPPEVQAAIRAIGPTMGNEAVIRTGDALRPLIPESPAPTLADMRYGPDDRHRLDVFAPGSAALPVPGGGSRPVLVFVHGGGFVGGDKLRPGAHFYQNIAAWAVRNGMVGVNITYRLAPAHSYPAVIEDITAALAWVRQNIAAQGGDPARIILMGQSAGAAHVADYLARHADAPGVAAAVMVSGVYDVASYPPGPTASAYYGREGLAERSARPGLTRLRIPLLLAIAELEPQPFRDQGMALRPLLPNARFIELAGHNHFSTVFGIGSADRQLTDAILALRSNP